MKAVEYFRLSLVSDITDIALLPTASGGLGLTSTNTIHDYLLEYEIDEKKYEFLNTTTSGNNEYVVRGYGVQAIQNIESSIPNQYNYELTVQLQYRVGEVNDLIDASAAIQDSIIKSGKVVCNLAGWSMSDLDIIKLPGESDDQEMLQGTFFITGYRVNNTI